MIKNEYARSEEHLKSGSDFCGYLHSLTIQFCHQMCDVAEQNGFGPNVAVQSVVQGAITCKGGMTQAQYDKDWLERHVVDPMHNQPCLAIMLFWGIYESKRSDNNSEMIRLGKMNPDIVNIPSEDGYRWARERVEAILPPDHLPGWWAKMGEEQDRQWAEVVAIAEASKMGKSVGHA